MASTCFRSVPCWGLQWPGSRDLGGITTLSACLVAIALFARPVWAVEVDMRAAWSGIATKATFTELNIGIRAAEAGTYTIVLPGAQAQTVIKVDLPQDERVSFSVPYPVSGPDPIAWTVTRGDVMASDPVAQGQEPVFSRVAKKRWDINLAVSSQTPRTVNVLSATLPTLTQAYDSIRSITLTPRDLRNLTPDQLHAFETFLQRCGRTVVLEAQSLFMARLRQHAGCGGRQVQTENQRALPTELPTSREVRGLVNCPDCGGALYRLTGLLVVYVSLLIAASLTGRARILAVLGISASLILILVSRSNESHIVWTSWSQADAGSSSQVRRSVLVVEGRGNSVLTIPLSRTSVPQLPLPHKAVLHYRVARSQSNTATLIMPTGYLTHDSLSFVDTGPVETQYPDLASDTVQALADRIAQKTGLALELRASVDTVTQPAEGIRAQWLATVTSSSETTK